MSEKYENKSSFEQKIDNNEATTETKKITERLINNQEDQPDLSPRDIEAKTEMAKIEAEKNSHNPENSKNNQEKFKKHSAPNKISKERLNESYKKTMKIVQKDLSPVNSIFSRIIHNNSIEKVSDIIGKTITRPNAMLSGAFTAFFITLITYTIAKKNGYQLSGFETILSFIVGWIIGNIYDYIKLLLTGRKD